MILDSVDSVMEVVDGIESMDDSGDKFVEAGVSGEFVTEVSGDSMVGCSTRGELVSSRDVEVVGSFSARVISSRMVRCDLRVRVVVGGAGVEVLFLLISTIKKGLQL